MYFLFVALFWEISNSRRYTIQNFGPQNISHRSSCSDGKKCTKNGNIERKRVGEGGHGHPRTPPSYVPAVVRENEYVLHFIDEQGLFSMGILRETLNSASRTLQC